MAVLDGAAIFFIGLSPVLEKNMIENQEISNFETVLNNVYAWKIIKLNCWQDWQIK